MINIILFGPPGSGKGTQAVFLAEKFNLVHISTGDLFRYEMGNNTPLGIEAKAYMSKGELVPDSVTIGMLKNKVNANPQAKGFIFDGFPRTIPQAEALDDFLKESNHEVNVLISLDVSEEELVSRLLQRGLSSGRPDDTNEDIIRNRIKVYHQETKPVFDYYDQQCKSELVNGVGTIDDITSQLIKVVESHN